MNASLADMQARRPAAHVRKATSTDLPGILAMQRLSLRTLGRRHYTAVEIETYLQCTPTTEEYLISDATYHVAYVDGRLAGCGGWSVRAPAYSAVTRDPVRSSERHLPKVRAMYVHPDFARRGVGRQLLVVIERAIVDAGFDQVGLDATLGGVPLYERCGYSRVGHTHAELPNGLRMPFVCMHKHLIRTR